MRNLGIRFERKSPSVRAALTSVAVFLLVVLSVYPGSYSPDAVYMLWMGRSTFPLTDWHPVPLTWLWGVLSNGLLGPGNVWVFQTALGAWAVFLVARRLLHNASIFLVAIFLTPPWWGVWLHLWKDSQLTFLWLAVAVMCVHEDQSSKRATLLLFAFFIVGLRYNSLLLGLFPILIFFIDKRPLHAMSGLEKAKLWTASGATLGGIAILNVLVFPHFADVNLRPESTAQTWDIAAISVERGDLMFPAELLREQPCSLTELEDQYTEYTSDFLIFPKDACIDLVLPDEKDEWLSERDENLSRTWIAAVTENPGPFVEHRWNVFKRASGISGTPPGAKFYSGAESAESLFSATLLRRTAWLIDAGNWAERNMNFMFRPYLWVLFAITAIATCRQRRLKLALLLTTTLASHLLVSATTPASDIRYSYPLLATCSLCLLLAADEAIAGRFQRLSVGQKTTTR